MFNPRSYKSSIPLSSRWIISLMMIPTCILLVLIAYSLGNKTEEGYRTIEGSQIRVFVDHTRSKEIQDILKEGEFTALPGSDVPNFGFNRADVWLKFQIDPLEFSKKQLTIQLKNTVLDVVELYEYRKTEFHTLAQTGDLVPFSSRPVGHRNYRFPILLSGDETITYYLKVNSGGEQLYTPLEIWDNEVLREFDQKDHLFLGAYFGLIAFVLLFNLFIYLLLREKSNLYYVQYNFFLVFLQFSLTGFAVQFLWPNSSYLANVSNPFLASLAVFSLLQFSRSFLNLSEYLPRVNLLFRYIGWLILLNAFLALTNVQPALYVSILIVNLLTLLLNIAIIPVALYVLRKGFAPAKFFLLAFVILIITVFGFVLTNLGIIQNDFFASYGLLAGSACEVILLSFAIVDKFKSFKEEAVDNLKQLNKVVSEQNIVLEQKVQERTLELYNQQQEVLASIRYARRIQNGILPAPDSFKKIFNNHFVLYKPKDIVSGDFYRIHSQENDVNWLALGDCTGHGVPGAMMTVLCSNLVREALINSTSVIPSDVLEKTDALLLNALATGEYDNATDGMDLALVRIDRLKKELQFAGANLSLYVLRNKEIITLSETRRPIGMIEMSKTRPFQNNVFEYQTSDRFFLFTDGYADQFGGPNQKKIKHKQILQLISQSSDRDLIVQGQLLLEFFENWKLQTEQTDDMCFIGFQV